MRVAIIENTAVTHHGQVGVALHEAAAVIDLYRPWRDGLLPAPGSFDALVSFGGEQDALADAIGNPDLVNTRYWNDLGNWGGFDLVVNATSAGHSHAALVLPSSLLASRAICYDLSYGKPSIGFLAWARSVGAESAIDGLGMLVEQAAEAFEIWHGQRPETDAIYAELRTYLPGDSED